MKVPIFINRTKYENPREQLTGREILALAGFGEDHDLFLLQGEGDPTGGTPVGLDQEVQIKAGEHFRAIPGNRNFG
ncbi:MAG: Multiubiquitin [Actinomycetota bacterium]|nr:Multiubiquitin [Actinomycetota bacterium]